jgi:hypothetical protein
MAMIPVNRFNGERRLGGDVVPVPTSGSAAHQPIAHHKPDPAHKAISKLEAAYHKADIEACQSCAACRRQLPACFCRLDPIRPLSGYILEGAELTALDPASLTISESFEIAVRDKRAYIRYTAQPKAASRGASLFPKIHAESQVSTDTIWENDIANLQYLCTQCLKEQRGSELGRVAGQGAECHPRVRSIRVAWSTGYRWERDPMTF